jgi:hypothetical protein
MLIAIYNRLQRFVALIHNKYCSSGATGPPPLHALQRRDSEDFGRLVYSPDNLTHQRHDPDWGALERSFDRPGEFIQPPLWCN